VTTDQGLQHQQRLVGRAADGQEPQHWRAR
jgi:hypothetical protein